jgi:hypothetical protein
MATEDRPIDRKVDAKPTPDDVEGDTDAEDLRPDMEHFDNFKDTARDFRDRLPDLRVPNVPVVPVVMASLFVAVGGGALSVAYGTTSLAAAHGGTYAALIVAGVFAVVYGYVGLRFVDTVTNA